MCVGKYESSSCVFCGSFFKHNLKMLHPPVLLMSFLCENHNIVKLLWEREQWESFSWTFKSGVWPMCKIPSDPVICLMNLYNILTFPAWNMPLCNIPEIQGPLECTLWEDGCLLLFQQAYSSWLAFLFTDSLTDSCAGSVWSQKEKRKSHNAAHYYPTKQMGDHATHMHSLKFLHSGIFRTKSRYSCLWKPLNILVVTLKEWQ